jgi:DNA-binding NarL/FixJ family response regulator
MSRGAATATKEPPAPAREAATPAREGSTPTREEAAPPKETPATPPRPPGPRKYRVVVADDHSIVRRGIRTLLESIPGVEVCAEAANGAEALYYVGRERPDLVVVDLTMPEKNGLEVTRLVREELPTTDVLILTMHFSEEVAREVVRCGARGYLLKSDADIELIYAVRHIQQHKPFFTGKLAVSMAESFVRDTGARNDKNNNNDQPLSARELEVVQLLASGKSNKEAAAMIGVSTRTVESHRNHIMRKMDFRSFSDLIRFAIRNNLIQP